MKHEPIVSARHAPACSQRRHRFLKRVLGFPAPARHSLAPARRFRTSPLGLLAPAFAVLALTLPAAAAAEVRVEEPWVRATIAGQQASGAFMTLTSSKDARLIAVETAVAGVAEIHEMALENNVMRMRRIDGLELPAGKPVELRPGGYHLMLMDLKAPLNTGEHVDLTLTVEDAGGKRERIEVNAPIRPLTAGHGHGAKTHGH